MFAFGTFMFLLTAQLTKAQHKPEWTWKDANGERHTRSELDEILRKHGEWIQSYERSGSRANLSGANLLGAYLIGANLSDADLNRADLSGAYLRGANLSDANLIGANLSNADLRRAVLNRADLSGANLSAAKLSSADLSSADLSDATLAAAVLDYADLGHAIFEPKLFPELRGIAGAKNLELLTYEANPDALVQLRKQFQDGGFREQERNITYALKRRETERYWMGCKSRRLPQGKTRAILWSSDSNLADCGSFVLNKVFFDCTSQYGMSPGRPLSLGVLLWLLCSVLYFTCIRASGEAGLYRVYGQDIQEDPSAHRRVVRISPRAVTQMPGLRRFLQYFRREWLVLRTSMFFSLMSAFNIGFRDINFGRWLRLLTRQEFDIKAVGWARVVAGWQSLITVFLIALWVLTYFGRPFG